MQHADTTSKRIDICLDGQHTMHEVWLDSTGYAWPDTEEFWFDHGFDARFHGEARTPLGNAVFAEFVNSTTGDPGVAEMMHEIGAEVTIIGATVPTDSWTLGWDSADMIMGVESAPWQQK